MAPPLRAGSPHSPGSRSLLCLHGPCVVSPAIRCVNYCFSIHGGTLTRYRHKSVSSHNRCARRSLSEMAVDADSPDATTRFARSITSSIGNTEVAQLLTISSDSAATITTRFTTAGGLCPETRISDSPSPTDSHVSPTPTRQHKDHRHLLKDDEHARIAQSVGLNAFQIEEFCDADVV